MTPSAFDQADFVIITALEKEAQAVVKRLDNRTVKRDQQHNIRTFHEERRRKPRRLRRGGRRQVFPPLGEGKHKKGWGEAVLY